MDQLTVIDSYEGMPLCWRLGESPAKLAIGLVILGLGRRIGK